MFAAPLTDFIRPISAAATLAVDRQASISNPAALEPRFTAPPDGQGLAITQSRPEFESEAVARLPVSRIAVARGLILAREFANRTALSPLAADHLVLIVEEWLNNVTEHSGAPAGGRIVLLLQHRPGLVRLTATDAGKPFDPRTVPFEGPNLTRGGGAGLALIQAWCRITDYRRAGGRNRLVFEMMLP